LLALDTIYTSQIASFVGEQKVKVSIFLLLLFATAYCTTNLDNYHFGYLHLNVANLWRYDKEQQHDNIGVCL
jgi:hypothetical protein